MINYLSNMLIPGVILLIIVSGIVKKINVYEEFIAGVKDGIGMILNIFPTVFAMCFATGMLQDSNILNKFSTLLSPILKIVNIPSFIIPLFLSRFISHAASIGVLVSNFKTYGPDSFEGIASSILMCTSETLIFTVSLYLGSVGIKKSRYIMLGGVLINIVGLYVTIILSRLMF